MQRNSTAKRASESLVIGRSLIFHPLVVLVLSFASALLYAVWITWRFDGHDLDDLEKQYLYVVTIIVPFVCFLLDRVEQIHNTRIASLVVDCLVVGVSMMRITVKVPFVSGHTLFLTYAIMGPSSRITKITALLVMLEVIYLKYFVWHDPITSSGGIVLGTVAALMANWIGSKSREAQRRCPDLAKPK